MELNAWVLLLLQGWIAVIILLLVFFPLAWIPCCMQDCFQVGLVPERSFCLKARKIRTWKN